MKKINRKNLQIRLILAIITALVIAFALWGGPAVVEASISDVSPPEPYSQSSFLENKMIREHISKTAFSESYTASYKKQVTIGNQTRTTQEMDITINNINTRGYMKKHTDSGIIQVFETESNVYKKAADGTVNKTNKKKGDATPVLRNQLVNLQYGIATFRRFDWLATSETEKTVTYKLTKADPRKIPEISTISFITGSAVINKESGTISKINITVIGSSAEYPSETATVRYEYSTDIGKYTVERPKWAEENSSES